MYAQPYATNVVPIQRARSAAQALHPLVEMGRRPWRKDDVARELNVSIRTVTRYMAEGLPFYTPPWGGPPCFDPAQSRTWALVHCRGRFRRSTRRRQPLRLVA